MPSKDITSEYLREQMRYDPETGDLWWRVPTPNRRIDRPAGGGTGSGKYRQIEFAGRRVYYVHRLVWLYVHGEWPEHAIDHINGDPTDNRIANLREADAPRNGQNRPRQANNRSGFKGIYLKNAKLSKPWTAEIAAHGKRHRLGYFATPEEAHEAYKEAAARLHGEFARTE